MTTNQPKSQNIGQSSVIEPEQLLNNLLKSAQKLLPCDFGVLALWDQDAEALVPFYGQIKTENSMRTTESLPILRLGEGVIGQVAQSRMSMNVPDVTTNPHYRQVDENVRSELAVPVLHDDELLGVLDVECYHPNAYRPEHVEVMQALAGQAALLIETLRLYKVLRGNYDELQDAHSDLVLRNEISRLTTSQDDPKNVIPAIVKTLCQYSRSDAVILFLWNETTRQVNYAVDHNIIPNELSFDSFQIAETSLDLPLLQGKSMVFNAIQSLDDLPLGGIGKRVHSVLALPLVARRRSIGGVVFLRAKLNAPFSTQQIQRLQLPLDQIALSLDNKELLYIMEQRLEESQSLLRLSEIAAHHIKFDETMAQILDITERMLGIVAAGIMVYDRQDGVLIPQKGFGFSETFYDNRLPVNVARSLSAVAFNMGHPQYTNDVSTLSGHEAEIAAHCGLANMLVAPLRIQDDPLGVIMVANRNIPFDADAARLLTVIGSHIATALRNFDYDSRLRLFRGFSEISRRVSSELVSEHVLVEACQSVVESIPGVDHAGIVLHHDGHQDGGLVVAEYPIEGAIGQRLQLKNYPVYEQMEAIGEPIVVNDVPSAQDWLGPNYDLLMNIGVQSLIVIPLVVQNEFIGSLGLDARRKHHHFTEAEVEFANAIAGQIGVSIQNAKLFEQIEARTEELQEANRLKSEFLAKMSHELRTPMNSILGFSEALTSGIYGELNSKQTNRLSRITHSGHNLLSLIDDLLDISKIDAGKMELSLGEMDLVSEIRACISGFEPQTQAKNLSLSVDAPDSAPYVVADSMRIRQIINNLLSNALKFTSEGGVSVKLTVQDRYIQVAVQDTGIGIDASHLDIIFDEFRQADGSTTRRFGGTGLGLAITRRFIQMMHGKIWVESTLGKGSTFYFTVPIAPQT